MVLNVQKVNSHLISLVLIILIKDWTKKIVKNSYLLTSHRFFISNFKLLYVKNILDFLYFILTFSIFIVQGFRSFSFWIWGNTGLCHWLKFLNSYVLFQFNVLITLTCAVFEDLYGHTERMMIKHSLLVCICILLSRRYIHV